MRLEFKEGFIQERILGLRSEGWMGRHLLSKVVMYHAARET